VLTEKLMGHSIHECKEMGRVSRETGKLLATGHQRHYSILYDNAVHTIGTARLIGDLHSIRAQWHRGNLPGKDSWKPPMPGDEKLVKQLDGWKKSLDKAKPAEIDAYLELADLLERDSGVEEAEQVLMKALAASGNDIKVREHLEDRQLRWARHRVHIAEQRLKEEDTPAHRQTLERLKAAQVKHEVEIYSARCARYPENLTWRYELAMRLKAAGNHVEAIRHFQDVLQDPRRKGAVSLELGECFQKIKQYQLAMRNYIAAVESLTDRELELRKRALYRAGVLAAGLDDRDAAQKYLGTLAGLDFGYRDVAQRLDKLAAPKDNNAGG